MKCLLPSAAAIAAAPVFSSTAWANGAGEIHGHEGMWHGGWGGMILGPLMMIIFVAVIVVLVVLAVRWLGGPGARAQQPTGRAPLEILEERFARGEIEREEFEARRGALGG